MVGMGQGKIYDPLNNPKNEETLGLKRKGALIRRNPKS